jgi:hypothetical protein
MPLYSKKEFAVLCGMKDASQLRVSITRDKKVIVGDSGLIDSQHPVNKIFVEHRKVVMGRNKAKGAPTKQAEDLTADDMAEQLDREISGLEDQKATMKAKGGDTFGYAAELERLKTEIAKRELIKRDIDIEKKRGETMPVELFMAMLRQYNQSNNRSFRRALDQVVSRFSIKYKLSIADQAEMRKIVVEEVNTAIDNSTKEVKSKIKDMVTEYSQTRERGERAA